MSGDVHLAKLARVEGHRYDGVRRVSATFQGLATFTRRGRATQDVAGGLDHKEYI